MRIAADDVLLGYEDELVDRLGVSRITLRQAVRLLEHEHLIKVRRGVNGGFFTRLPSADAVGDMAAMLLSWRNAPVADLPAARLSVEMSTVRLAAQYAAGDDLRRLRRIAGGLEPAGGRDFQEDALEFHRLVARASGNELLGLMVELTLDLTPHRDMSAERPAVSKAHSRIAEAIVNGEPDLAARRMRRHLSSALAWAVGDGRPLVDDAVRMTR
jgi:DNA-binding FadR family transcriptional regulator